MQRWTLGPACLAGLIWALVLVEFPALASGLPSGEPLTLAEATSRASDPARSALAARSAAEAEAASARARSARGRLWPTLGIDLGTVATNDPVAAFSFALKQERFSAQEFFLSDPNHPGTVKDWSGAVGAEWVLDAFGATRGKSDAAARAAEAAQLRDGRTREHAAFGATAAFLRAHGAEESLRLFGDILADRRQDAELARLLEEQGLVTAADPARALAAVAEAEAEKAGVEAERRSARAQLARFAGPDAASRPLAPPPDPGIAEADGVAPTRSDLGAAAAAVSAARAADSSAKASLLPSFVAQGRWEVHTPKPGGSWGDSFSVGLGARVPIWTSGTLSGQREATLADLRAAEAAARDLAAAAEEEIESARGAALAAQARREALEKAAAAAAQAREIVRIRYEGGAARLTELLEVRGAETRVRLAIVRARTEELLARYALRFALGLPLLSRVSASADPSSSTARHAPASALSREDLTR